ncbi:MAG: hypothetical protein CMM60_04750 [Rhodospirillaceae bacterium]|nr:hypothetical protein [Rhodospirillaceae bacterium]
MPAMKSVYKITAAIVLAVPLAACQSMQDNPKQTGGTLLGAGLGALVGSQVGGGKGKLAAVAVGALAGAWAGSEIGKSLDKADRLYAQRNAQDGLEYTQTGQSKSWRNPDSGNSGTITPTRTYRTAEGKNCRDFETTIYVDGKQETGTGRACRRTDGTWQIVQ